MNARDTFNCNSFTQLIHELIDACNECVGISEMNNMLQELNQLQSWRDRHGYDDSSISIALNKIGKYLEDSHLSQVSIYFYLEQLRIEQLYLGHLHPDLANTLNSIGQIYSRNDEFSEAAEYFSRARLLLENNNKKGKLYALVLCNIGLIQHGQFYYTDAKETFDLAVKEQQNASGEFHPDVAELYLRIGKLKLDAGNAKCAMGDLLNALMIMRMVNGNDALQISEILYYIGMINEINGEHTEALNVFNQSLHIVRTRTQAKELSIIILHKIFSIHHQIGDIDNAIISLEDIMNIIKEKVGENHICVAVVLGLLRNLYLEQGMIEKSEEIMKDIEYICYNISRQSAYHACNEFVEFVTKEFGCAIEDDVGIAAAAA